VKKCVDSLFENKVVEDPELEFRNHLSTGNKNRRYKYQDNSNTGKHGLLKNKYWMPKDFKM
jgi:hypothetical protein